VFQILFEDDLEWEKYAILLPNGTRARIRRQALSARGDTGCNHDAVDAASSSRKRRRDDRGGLEGVLKGRKRGKYVLELLGGAGTRYVAAEDLQPLLSERQAAKLFGAVPTASVSATP
jgi:hypothetical protein